MQTLEAILVAALLMSQPGGNAATPGTEAPRPPVVLEQGPGLEIAGEALSEVASEEIEPRAEIGRDEAPSPARVDPDRPPQLHEHRDPLWDQGVMVDPDVRTWTDDGNPDGFGIL